MNSVITAEQGKKITHGRTPHVPVEYETACKALQECLTLDEAKYWDNKADALAAWAKIYHDNKAERQARALKLWAYRRMGELARELRPGRKGGRFSDGGYKGQEPGPRSLLMEHGLSSAATTAAARLASHSESAVRVLAELPRPPSPISAMDKLPALSQKGKGAFGSGPDWRSFWGEVCTLLCICRKLSAKSLAHGVEISAVKTVRDRLTALLEWLDEFERHLPKEDG